ncbi:MAG: recombinase family protein [Algoriphagus sp.]|uniref:recombinase family protein n=1 Tax=Algoriphagus sp. TaxID=1872435 RepID=UPI002731E71B|nr:recombinase family protein [Algoriphagus sp.]MDP2040263.1 recombinase family protein [Algoriphagus sp.]MDP3472625.1 recombinase family protein [Algoriphagus sp.]
MKTAILYIRVSTDEQADKGYSQRSQEEMLLKYCNSNNIYVEKVIYEDYSAKTFFRPEWVKLLSALESKRSKRVNLILFTKWDRFSRNAGDAYMMINTLRKLGIEPQAIEQPLDLNVPENKMMLAIYLSAPEVENDRRALNVIYGMRRAMKEGRWLWKAPYGYLNTRTPDGRPTIALNEEEAKHMKWMFETLALGDYNTEQVLLQARRNGAKIKRNRFWGQVRNPFYKGIIKIPEFKGEPETEVMGQHTAIVSTEIFDRVQEVLDGKKRKRKTQIVCNDEIPLRGFLNCPKCNRMLTASASKGRNQYYHYYHCTATCGVRFKAKEVNEAFLNKLAGFKPKPGLKEVYKIIFEEVSNSLNGSAVSEQKKLQKQIEDLNSRLAKARDLLIKGDLSSDDYKAAKKQMSEQILRLETHMDKIEPNSDKELTKSFTKALEYAGKLDFFFSKGDLGQKRRIIGSIFPENLTFDGVEHRTARINEVVNLIYLVNSEIGGKKNGQRPSKMALPTWVGPLGIEPSTY